PAFADAASVSVAWDTSQGAAGYILYWGRQPGIYTNSLNVGAATSAQVSDLASGTPYYFTVRAYNASGAVSGPSAEVAAIPAGSGFGSLSSSSSASDGP